MVYYQDRNWQVLEYVGMEVQSLLFTSREDVGHFEHLHTFISCLLDCKVGLMVLLYCELHLINGSFV